MKSNFFKEWLAFSQREQRGIIFLSALLLLLLVISPIYRYFIRRPPSDSEIEILQQYAATLKEAEQPRYHQLQDKYFEKTKPKLFAFDPNTISIDSLQMLGFSQKQAQAIVNYRERGGKFRSAEKFFNLRIITDRQKATLQNYVNIVAPPKGYLHYDTVRHDTFHRYTPRTFAIVEINLADTAQLRTLPGIGTYFAKKIVEHRERLGGFVQPDQLLEIDRFGEERLQRIMSRISIDATLVRRFTLDSSNLLLMRRHPYIGLYAARGILYYEHLRSRSATLDELRENDILTSQQVEKLRPYVQQ